MSASWTIDTTCLLRRFYTWSCFRFDRFNDNGWRFLLPLLFLPGQEWSSLCSQSVNKGRPGTYIFKCYFSRHPPHFAPAWQHLTWSCMLQTLQQTFVYQAAMTTNNPPSARPASCWPTLDYLKQKFYQYLWSVAVFSWWTPVPWALRMRGGSDSCEGDGTVDCFLL